MKFTNEPTMELRRADVRERLQAALAELDPTLPLEVPVLVGGERGSASGLESTDPGDPQRVLEIHPFLAILVPSVHEALSSRKSKSQGKCHS